VDGKQAAQDPIGDINLGVGAGIENFQGAGNGLFLAVRRLGVTGVTFGDAAYPAAMPAGSSRPDQGEMIAIRRARGEDISAIAEITNALIDTTTYEWTSTRHTLADRLAWFERHATMEQAIMREKRIKKWNRRWKLELIEAENPDWRDLAEDFGYEPLV